MAIQQEEISNVRRQESARPCPDTARACCRRRPDDQNPRDRFGDSQGNTEAIAPVLPFAVRATVRNHLAGKIEQWFFQTEGYGVVFIMNCASTTEAHEILEKQPLGVPA
jgi:hypothetical protein